VPLKTGKENYYWPNVKMTLTGFEPTPDSSTKTACPGQADAESDAVLPGSALQTVLDALAKLNPDERAKLALMMLNGGGEREHR
jgi:hypothetical protein